MERVPEGENLVWTQTQTENFNHNTNHDGYEQKGEDVVHKILVPKLDVLELHRAGKLRRHCFRHFVFLPTSLTLLRKRENERVVLVPLPPLLLLPTPLMDGNITREGRGYKANGTRAMNGADEGIQ